MNSVGRFARGRCWRTIIISSPEERRQFVDSRTIVRRLAHMATQEQLQEIERALGFRYPESFASMFEEFASLRNTESFRSAFPHTRLLSSQSEITAARERIPITLLPFMREEQPSWPDIYAFDLNSAGPEFRVVVWSDHASVRDWENFPVFLQWVRERIAKHDHAT